MLQQIFLQGTAVIFFMSKEEKMSHNYHCMITKLAYRACLGSTSYKRIGCTLKTPFRVKADVVRVPA